MWLKNMTDKDKAKAFEKIVREYNKDTDIPQFGRDAQEVIKWCKDWFADTKEA